MKGFPFYFVRGGSRQNYLGVMSAPSLAWIPSHTTCNYVRITDIRQMKVPSTLSPNTGSNSAGWIMGRSVPSPAEYVTCGSIVSSPAESGGAPAEKAFWHILKATELSFLHLYADPLTLSVFHVTFGGQSRYLGATKNRPGS